jgi:low temperature requirement protein LtrA
MSEGHVEREQRVTPLELFFDLVFVFAFTQVTTVLSDNPTWSGLGHGLLILAVLWWAWSAYAWLTNSVAPEQGAVWGTMILAFAVETTLEHVGDDLATIPALALSWGPAIHLFAYVALGVHLARRLSRDRLVAGVACAVLLPVATRVPAVVALAFVAAGFGSRSTRTSSSGGGRHVRKRARSDCRPRRCKSRDRFRRVSAGTRRCSLARRSKRSSFCYGPLEAVR